MHARVLTCPSLSGVVNIETATKGYVNRFRDHIFPTIKELGSKQDKSLQACNLNTAGFFGVGARFGFIPEYLPDYTLRMAIEGCLVRMMY